MATDEYRDPRGEFAVALKAAGLMVEDGPVMDGQLHRVRVEGAKPGTRDGSYVGHLDGKPSGFIENFKTGYRENWSASDVQHSPAERAESIAQMQRARAQRAADLSALQSDTAERVSARWESLADVPPAGQNAYLARKGVQAHGVKFDGERLVVPLRDVRGKLWSLQAIPPEEGAVKMFERGGRKAGNMHLIGEILPGAEVLVAEGYATGASLHQATGKAVAVAFDAGNLDAVVDAIKQRHPTSPIYIMGDNDRAQDPNVGFDKANAAAQKHGVAVAFPEFREPGKASDFNDLHASEGLAAVRAQVDKALGRSAERTREAALPGATATRGDLATERGNEAGQTTDAPKIDGSSSVKADAPAPECSEQLTSRDADIGTAHAAQPAEVGGPAAATLVQAIGVADAAKVTSEVAQGKEVRALDVASAGASVAMTANAGGPAVQPGAQAIAGVSAVDAGERALNTAEISPKEPDPANVADRKDIGRRNDELLAVPRDALDELTARELVKQDIAALHLIDTPAERHAVAVAMGHNAQNHATYKAELARQDPHAAEVVALAFANEQQMVGAKEDRKALEIASVAPALASVDTINRVAQRQEGVDTIDRGPLPQAGANTIERVAQREAELNATKRQRVEPPLEDRFNVVTRFARGRDYYFRDQPEKVAFKERWLSMQTSVDAPVVVKAMLDRAQERGWQAIRVGGSVEFQRQAWIAATARGIKAVGYEPTQGDRATADEERARLARDNGRNPSQAQTRLAVPPIRAREQTPERPSLEPMRAGRMQDSRATHKPPAQTADKPIAAPLRIFLTELGVAAAEIEATVTNASASMQRDRVYVGQLVSHGADHYEFDKKNGQSYYVKLQSAAGEKVIWGVDLRRALDEEKIKVGDNVAIEHRGVQPVTVSVKDRDASGNVVGEHEQVAKRNSWHAVNIDQFRRDATKAVVPEPTKQGPSAQPRVDVPGEARTAKSNRQEALVSQALEKALDTKKVPEELRPAVRAQLRKDLDVRMALGKPVKVAIYDPAAPPREQQRTVQLPQRQVREHARRR